MKRIIYAIILIFTLSFCLSCFAKEDKVTPFIEKLDLSNPNLYDKATINIAFFESSIVDNIPEAKQETITGPVAVQVPILNYHFFYDENIYCGEDLCLDVNKFKEQLDYLISNNYKILTIKEFKDWMYGEIELPEKSVLITIDDGACGTSKINGNILIPVLEEYKVHAILFLITAWWDKENYKSDYLSVQSHGNDIHRKGSCKENNIACLSDQELIDDLNKSINLVDDNLSFAYPFYTTTDSSINIVGNLFSIAFVGGNRKATREDDKRLIPRYPIYDSTTMDEFINIVN